MDELSLEIELAIIQNKTMVMLEYSEWDRYGASIEIHFPMNKLFKYVKNKYHKNSKKSHNTHRKLEDYYIANWAWIE